MKLPRAHLHCKAACIGLYRYRLHDGLPMISWLTSFTGESHDAYQQVEDGQLDENKAEFSHELLGGAGAFAAMKVFEDHQRKEGMLRIAQVLDIYGLT